MICVIFLCVCVSQFVCMCVPYSLQVFEFITRIIYNFDI